MTEKIIGWVEAWQGARKWTLHLIAIFLITSVYKWGGKPADFETYAWSVVALCGSFSAGSGIEWLSKGKVTK